MKKIFLFLTVVCLFISTFSVADTFGTGTNQFEIEFVTISGDASSANGTNIGDVMPSGFKSFTDPTNNYRMGKFEITNDQWNMFKNAYGTVNGSPSEAYDQELYWSASKLPASNVSWLEAAQFVNWLNVSKGYSPAYKFTGTKGTTNYSLSLWRSNEMGYDLSNPLRNKDAFYFLPTENEWVKAGYWNGTALQNIANLPGNGVNAGVDVNYKRAIGLPWAVGSGTEELNGTFDMMGNVWELMEGPYTTGDYSSHFMRIRRGGSYYDSIGLTLSSRYFYDDSTEAIAVGFRVASVIPEPCTLSLVAIGGLFLRKKKKKYSLISSGL